MPIYTIRNNTVDVATPPKTQITLTAPANGRVKLRGLLLSQQVTGNASTEFELLRLSVDATGSSQSVDALDPDSAAARSTALSTITAEGTPSTVLIEMGKQFIASVTYWYPFGEECQYVNSSILAIRKSGGSAQAQQVIATLFVEE